MNLISIATLVIITIGTCFNAIRWQRIAQREHYIPGYITKFYFRWVRSRGLNRFILFITLVLCIISLFFAYIPIIISVINIYTPVGLSLKSRTSKVDKTERLNRVTYCYYFLVVLVSIFS